MNSHALKEPAATVAAERTAPATMTEAELRAAMRNALPEQAFQRRPWRAAYALAHMGLILLGSLLIVLSPMHGALALAVALAVGNSYASLMFFGHELAHGSILRSRRGQDFFLYCAGLIFCISPTLWRVWHQVAHHGHPNVPGRDPDNFGNMAGYQKAGGARWFLKLAPGSGSLWSAPYLFVFFTLQAQNVLWRKSKDRQFPTILRTRALVETFLMIGFWIALAWTLGARDALFVVVVPMIVANFILLSYIMTNHMLRPAGPGRDVLDVTMSVNTWKWLDRLHFNFSHHVEHHLFPTMGSENYPLVRRWLLENVPDRYVSPPHWKALVMLFRTPRLYADDGVHVVDPAKQRTFALDEITSVLRGDKGLRALEPDSPPRAQSA